MGHPDRETGSTPSSSFMNDLSHTANSFKVTPCPIQVGLGTGAVGVAPAGHARGSHGWRFEVAGDGAAIAAAVGAVVAVVPDVDEGEEPFATGVDGALTANWVPVTTVTWAPSATWAGS